MAVFMFYMGVFCILFTVAGIIEKILDYFMW